VAFAARKNRREGSPNSCSETSISPKISWKISWKINKISWKINKNPINSLEKSANHLMDLMFGFQVKSDGYQMDSKK